MMRNETKATANSGARRIRALRAELAHLRAKTRLTREFREVVEGIRRKAQ